MKKQVSLLLAAAVMLCGCASSGEPNHESESSGTNWSTTEGVDTSVSVSEGFDTSAAYSESANSENSSQANNYVPPEGSLCCRKSRRHKICLLF